MTHPFSVELYNQHMGNCVVVNGLGEEQVILTTDSLLVHGRPVKARPKSQSPDIDAYRLYTSNGEYRRYPTVMDLLIEIEDEPDK